MGCEPFGFGGQGDFICTRGKRQHCSVPNCEGWSSFQCDFPTPKGRAKTCSAHLCKAHRKAQPDGRDFCPPHHAVGDRQAALPLGGKP